MQNWQKNRNYRKRENEDGIITYTITVDNADIEVSEDVYNAYSQADRRERYCAERDTGRLLSLERMDDDDVLLSYMTDRHVESAEDTAIKKILTDQVSVVFHQLDAEEKCLIQALVIDGITERDYAVKLGLSQKGVNKRKQKALKKFSKIIGTQTE